MNGEPSSSLLGSILQKRGLGVAVGVIGVIGYLVGAHFLPDLGDPATRRHYEPFFTAAGALTAGIFVALAVASRDATSDVLLGVITVFFVGTAALGAVLALLPDACSTVYSVAFIALVGGGFAGLLSTAVIATVALLEARAARRALVGQALRDLMNEESGSGGGE